VIKNLRKSEPDMTEEARFLKVMTFCDKLRSLDTKKGYYQAFNMMIASFRELTKTAYDHILTEAQIKKLIEDDVQLRIKIRNFNKELVSDLDSIEC
jgi:exonuclease III